MTKHKTPSRPMVIGVLIAMIGLLFGGFVTANAAGAPGIPDNTVTSADVKYNSIHGWDLENGTVTGVDMKDGSLGLQELNASAQDAIADNVTDAAGYAFEANVANIGGPFAANAVPAGTFTLSAGSYKVSTDALFRSNATTSGRADLQVAVRAADESVWGQDLGTAFTGDSPVQAQREVSTHTTRIVTLDHDTEVTVYVFGYDNEGQGSPDAGLFDAYVNLAVEPVNILN